MKFVEPTVHHGVEPERFDGEITYELTIEFRCPHCVAVTEERVACLRCSEAEPESGCDHCAGCIAAIDAELVTNRTGKYLKFHRAWERDTLPHGLSIGAYLQQPAVMAVIQETHPEGVLAVLRPRGGAPLSMIQRRLAS